MNKNGYKIMEVTDATHSRLGEILVVKANPVEESNSLFSVTPYVCDKTETFFFPNKKKYVDRILQIADGNDLWYPDEDDFVDEMTVDEITNRKIICHRYFPPFDFGHQSTTFTVNCLIPNMDSKIQTLKDKYIQNSWFFEYDTFSDYVESLAEGNHVMNFFGWLFDRSDFSSYSLWQLPDDYASEYNRFLSACKRKNDNC